MRKCFVFLLLVGLMLSLSSCAIIHTKVDYKDNAERVTWGLLEFIPIYRYTVERQMPIPACCQGRDVCCFSGEAPCVEPRGCPANTKVCSDTSGCPTDKMACGPEAKKDCKPKGKCPMSK
jgi:hypothetical protein